MLTGIDDLFILQSCINDIRMSVLIYLNLRKAVSEGWEQLRCNELFVAQIDEDFTST